MYSYTDSTVYSPCQDVTLLLRYTLQVQPGILCGAVYMRRIYISVQSETVNNNTVQAVVCRILAPGCYKAVMEGIQDNAGKV